MTEERIAGVDDPRIALYRGLSDPELLRGHELFVAEGRFVVRRVIEDGRFRVRSVLVNASARRDLGRVLDRVAGEAPIFVCEAGQFPDITGFDIHRGCLALVERPPEIRLDDILDTARTIVALEAVANADNVGGVFRNAAALGADALLLSPACCDPYYRKAVRTSMGAVLRVPFARAGEWPDALARVKAAGFCLVALTPREPSEPIDRFALRGRTEVLRHSSPARIALIAGAEGSGLSREVESMADARVRIPIDPAVDSLNVAVAIGIALYALRPPEGGPYIRREPAGT